MCATSFFLPVRNNMKMTIYPRTRRAARTCRTWLTIIYMRRQGHRLSPSSNEHLQSFSDPNRSYFGWEIFRLADLLEAHIEVVRQNKNQRDGNRIIFDIHHRFYSVLCWLVKGAETEAYYSWSKSALQKEIVHMLQAIIYGVDQFLQCPSIEGRERIWSRYSGLFQNSVAVMDASENPIHRIKSKELEISTYPDYYYLQLNVKKLAIPMKMSSFFWSSSNAIISLFDYCWYFCCCHFQHQLPLYRLRDPMCTGQAFLAQSIPDYEQYLHSRFKDNH